MAEKKFRTYTEESRKGYGRDDRANLPNDDLKIGCLQRIADATEAMAKNHTQLIREKKQAEDSRNYFRDLAAAKGNTIAGLRGYITRLKKKLAERG